jgi:GTPase SAR1 family protein
MLVATKVDLADERVVTREEAEKLAREVGLTYLETSSKADMNVDEAFSELTAETVKRQLQRIADARAANGGVRVEAQKKKRGCFRWPW